MSQRTSLLVLPLVALLCGCAEVNQFLNGIEGGGGRARAPTVQASPVQLRRWPSLTDLAAYYCPQVTDNPVARMACSVAFGPQPPFQRLVFEFGMTITAHNPGNVPVPALDVLLALTLFPGNNAEALGAICVSLCGQQDPSCNGAPRPGACTGGGNAIRTISDFTARIPGLIEGLATGQVQSELRKSSIAAGGDVRLDLAFVMGIEQALRVIQKTAQFLVSDMRAGRQGGLQIPVSAQGTLFVQLPAVGRLGVGYGPLQTVWRIN